MKHFTDADIETVKPDYMGKGGYKRISINQEQTDLIRCPMWFHDKNLQQTASGYGNKLATPWKLMLNNRAYRIYCTIFSNSGTNWISVRGERIVVS